MATRQELLLQGVEQATRFGRAEARWRRLTLYGGIGIVGVMAIAALLAPFLTSSPNEQNLLATLQSPSWHHLFGTDDLGRDIFSRVVYAGRIDFQLAFVLTYVSMCAGMIFGAISGYFGGWVDSVIMGVVDVLIAFPFLVLVIAIIAVVGPGLESLYIAVLPFAWVIYARITRAEMLVLREQQFLMAAETLGFSRRRIILRHAIPNLLAPNLVFSMADVVLNIALVASLSFLGLGVQPPTAEWGQMAAEGQGFLLTAWWLTAFPGAAIVLIGVGLSLIGDGLAERLGRHQVQV